MARAFPANAAASREPEFFSVKAYLERRRLPAPGRRERLLDQDEQDIPAWRETGVRKCRSAAFLDSTSARRSGTRLLHRRDCGRRPRAARGRHESTHATVSDAAEEVFYLARTQFGIDSGDRRYASQGAIGALEPPAGARSVAQGFAGQSQKTRHAVESIGFEAGQ